MIVDPEGYGLVNAIESLLEDAERRRDQARADGVGARDLHPPGAQHGPGRRPAAPPARPGPPTAAGRGLTIGSAGTHPFAMWEDQRIVARPRYRELVTALRFVARQELIFGMHVHVGVDDPDKAIHVANGMRVHLAVLLALSANSPFWRADATGLLSARTPIFRTFPRVGIPPHYRDWARLRERDRVHGRVGRDGGLHVALVRRAPAPEVRHRRGPRVRLADARGAHARAGRARAGHGQGALRALRRGRQLGVYPWQMLDENKWLAARHGLDGELVDLPSSERVATKALARRLLDRLREHAQDLGSAGELEAIDDLLQRGNGAQRQMVVYEANHDLREVMAEIVASTAPEGPASSPSGGSGSRPPAACACRCCPAGAAPAACRSGSS